MRQTRILHVIRPAEGGMKGHLLTLARGLKAKGYDIEIACPPDTGLAAEVDKLGLPVHPIALVGPLHPVRDSICVKQLIGIMRRGRYDIIHFHGAKASLVGRIAALLAGCRNTVMTVHNFIIYTEVPPVKRLVFKYGEKLLSRVTARIITVSEALRNDLVQVYNIAPEKIIPVYNGIDTSFYQGQHDKSAARAKLNLGDDSVVVGTVARMAPQKGLNYLIEAVAAINMAQPASAENICFVIAGDGPLRADLEDQAKSLGVGEKIIFPGYIKDIPALLACFDLFVIPSIAEGLSITTIEAMAAGLPVVATRVGGLPELVKPGINGYLVEPREPSAIADAILSVLADPAAAKKLGTAGKRFAEDNFSNDKMVTLTSEIYREMLNLPCNKGLSI